MVATHVRTAVWALATLAIALGPRGAAVAQAVDEHSLKAAIIYRLLAFVEWPAARTPAPGAPLVVCVEATHPLAAPLRELARKPVRQWLLEVRSPDADGWARCHAWAGGTLPSTQRGLEALLVISDRSRQADGITHVWLALEGDKVGFELDLGNARRAGLQISSRLARLARTVHE